VIDEKSLAKIDIDSNSSKQVVYIERNEDFKLKMYVESK